MNMALKGLLDLMNGVSPTCLTHSDNYSLTLAFTMFSSRANVIEGEQSYSGAASIVFLFASMNRAASFGNTVSGFISPGRNMLNGAISMPTVSVDRPSKTRGFNLEEKFAFRKG